MFTACASSMNIEEVREKAIKGDAKSQFDIGYILETKEGDVINALAWYEKSANKNYAIAQNWLGNVYLEGRLLQKKDYNKAFFWYKKSADNGYFDAINNLAYMYDLGYGTKEDNKKAAELYELAATKGSIRGAKNLALMYRDGEGVEKSIDKTIEFSEKAASMGSIKTMYELGLFYETGKYVEKNYIKAYQWYDLARYYTSFSKDMNLKWSTRARLDDLKQIMSPYDIEKAKDLASKWNQANQAK